MQRICCRQFLLHTLVSAKPATRSFFRTNVSYKKGAAHFYRFFLNFGYIKKKAGMKNICFFYKYLFLIFGYL